MYTVFSISPAELGEEPKTEPKNIMLMLLGTYRTTPTLQHV
jgi:hypothetical protein